MLDLLKLVPYTERSILVHEGSGVEKMFFIVRGKIWSEPTTIRTTTFSFNASNDGHFCGEELLPRASVLQLGGLPISTRTVIAHTPVEAFVIEADDWKQLVNSFMLPDDQLPYIFRLTQKIWLGHAASTKRAAWARLKGNQILNINYFQKLSEILIELELHDLVFAIGHQITDYWATKLRASETLFPKQ